MGDILLFRFSLPNGCCLLVVYSFPWLVVREGPFIHKHKIYRSESKANVVLQQNNLTLSLGIGIFFECAQISKQYTFRKHIILWQVNWLKLKQGEKHIYNYDCYCTCNGGRVCLSLVWGKCRGATCWEHFCECVFSHFAEQDVIKFVFEVQSMCEGLLKSKCTLFATFK